MTFGVNGAETSLPDPAWTIGTGLLPTIRRMWPFLPSFGARACRSTSWLSSSRAIAARPSARRPAFTATPACLCDAAVPRSL